MPVRRRGLVGRASIHVSASLVTTMKVLFLSWEYPPHLSGGLGQHVKELVPALLELDPALELHVITPAFGGRTSHDNWTAARPSGRAPKPSDDRIYDDVLAANAAFVAGGRAGASRPAAPST